MHAEQLAAPTLLEEQVRKRLVATLFASESLSSAAQIASFTLMSIVAVELSGRDGAAGVPSTVNLLGQAAAAYPIGWLMDRAGRRAGLVTGYVAAALGAVAAVFAIGAGSFLGFCLGISLYGVGRAAGLQARFASAEIHAPAQRAKAIGAVVFAGTVGAVGGPLLVAPASELALRWGWSDLAGPFAAAALLFYLAMMLTFFLLRPDPMTVGKTMAQSASGSAFATGARPLRAILSLPKVQLALAAMIAGQLVMTTLMVITPLYMSRHGYDKQAISWVIMAHTLGMFGLSGATGWLIDRMGRLPVIWGGGVMLAASALLMLTDSSALWLLFGALFLLGLGWNWCFIGGSSLLADALATGERGRVQGAGDMLVSLASGAGSLSTGSLYAAGGMALVGAAGLGVCLALMALIFWSGRRAAPAAAAGD